MIQIPRGIPLNIEKAFRDIEREINSLNTQVKEIDTGATKRELDNLRREVARLTRKDNDESWLDFWEFSLGDLGFARDLTLGIQRNVYIPIPVRITGWTLVSDTGGNLEINILKVAYADFGVGLPVSICGTEKPTLSAAQKNQNLTINSWTQNVEAGSILSIDLTACLGIMQATLVLNIRRM